MGKSQNRWPAPQAGLIIVALSLFSWLIVIYAGIGIKSFVQTFGG